MNFSPDSATRCLDAVTSMLEARWQFSKPYAKTRRASMIKGGTGPWAIIEKLITEAR